MTTPLYIVLPVHNRRQTTVAFVASLQRQTCRDFHLVLIDDGSRDGTAEAVRALLPAQRLTILRGRGDWWWAGALQQAFCWLADELGEGDSHLLIINDDVELPADFLAQGLRSYRSRPGGLLLARQQGEDGAILETGVCADPARLAFRTARHGDEINCLSTRGLLLTWQIMKTVGGFHPRLLPHYLSDYEYTLRAARKGFPCWTSETFHLGQSPATTGLRQPDLASPLAYLRSLFSHRYVGNPLHGSAFLLLTCSLGVAIPTIARIWYSAALAFLKVCKDCYLAPSLRDTDHTGL